ncbi:trichohyalin [Trichomycterus rosablanca]|uniref:trichohyalin n=1 Tax=Trichomycterus rosablanca TaxID=2290929 RepID=UPI002F35A2A1
MSRMNWDNQLSSIISAADGSVAKIRERLAMHRRLTRGEDMYPVRDLNRTAGLDTFTPPSPSQTASALSGAVQWTDLAAIQAQLRSQSQAIESLTQTLQSAERERKAQQRQIQTLQEEVSRLEERLEDSKTEREREHNRKAVKDPSEERRLEQLKSELEREMSVLRDHINRARFLGNQEESVNFKLCREEVEELRREVDLLKIKLIRQEEDVYQQHSEARRQCERSSKKLESITDSFHTHSLELTRIISQDQHTQQEVRDLRLAVSELKDQVRGLTLRDRLTTPKMAQISVAAVAVETSPRRPLSSRSDLDDEFSPTPSLGDVSSDDLETSWLGKSVQELRHQEQDADLSLSGSDVSSTASGLGSNHSDTDSSELSLSDL